MQSQAGTTRASLSSSFANLPFVSADTECVDCPFAPSTSAASRISFELAVVALGSPPHPLSTVPDDFAITQTVDLASTTLPAPDPGCARSRSTARVRSSARPGSRRTRPGRGKATLAGPLHAQLPVAEPSWLQPT